MNVVRIGILSLLAASVVACSVVPGASPSPVPVPTDTPASPTEAPTASPAMETAAPTEGTSAPQTPDPTPYQNPGSDYDYRYDTPATEAPDSSPSAGDPVLSSAESGEHGTYLVGADGRALYIFASDHTGVSMCTGDCAENWPPLIVEEGSTPTAAEGIDGTLSTVTRTDGSLQLAYEDAPLYHFIGDNAPGDTNGHGVNDVWFLAEP